MRRLPSVVLLAVALACGARAQDAPPPVATPVVGDVLAGPPRPFLGSDGDRHLAYELRLMNVTAARATLRRLAALDAATGRPLLVLDADGIRARFTLGGMRGDGTDLLRGHQFGVAFLHLRLPADAPPPAALVHVVEVAFEAPPGGSPAPPGAEIRLGPTPVSGAPVPVLGPPLRGGGTIAADGCCGSTRHLRALLPLDGGLRLAQRFAVDWERLDADRRIARGDLRDPRSYAIYGAEVLAVADGTVAAARDGLPDGTPGAFPPDIALADADGNFVVLDVGGGAWVLYAHLAPGSVRVRAGDRVRRGDVLGAVGNSGNSFAPHLHLHAMDGPSPLASNGIPYVFDAFAVTAAVEGGTAAFDHAEATGEPLALAPRDPPTAARAAMPMDLDIVDWDAPRAAAEAPAAEAPRAEAAQPAAAAAATAAAAAAAATAAARPRSPPRRSPPDRSRSGPARPARR